METCPRSQDKPIKTTIIMKLLKELYAIHSMSGSEKKMRQYVKRFAGGINGTEVRYDTSGNVYITRGVAESYPCVVAHLDQVQHTHSKDFKAVETDDIIFGYSPSKKEIQGLGADDKNGIWVALNCLKEFDAIKVAFFVGEEIGCVGSSHADMSFFNDCRFVIEPDRRGSHDLITSIGHTELCSKEFLEDIRYEDFGYKTAIGLMTDVMELKEKGLGVSCINLSCGYYDPHTDNEYTVKADLINCLEFVKSIIRNCTKVYRHEFEYKYSGGWGYGGYGSHKFSKCVGKIADYGSLYDYCCELFWSNDDFEAYEAWEEMESDMTEWGITQAEFCMTWNQVMDNFGYGPGWYDDDDKEGYIIDTDIRRF